MSFLGIFTLFFKDMDACNASWNYFGLDVRGISLGISQFFYLKSKRCNINQHFFMLKLFMGSFHCHLIISKQL